MALGVVPPTKTTVPPATSRAPFGLTLRFAETLTVVMVNSTLPEMLSEPVTEMTEAVTLKSERISYRGKGAK